MGSNQQQNFRRRRAMKTIMVRTAVLVVAAVTMAAPAFADQMPAEREMSMESQGVETGYEAHGEASVSSDPEIRPPIEAGSLPSDVDAPGTGRDPADFPWYENLGGGE
jgi:hypothetical protein